MYMDLFQEKSMFRLAFIWMFPKIVVPPNHPILIGFSIINHPFWGTPIFGNTHIDDLEALLVTCLFIWVMLVVERVLRTSCDHG